ncbi:MAG: polysaccharide deacetylase family protein [Chloroflexi bacterium]|nr:polysaccharide deacetylase family protein [Chloroflexota bacterium]
MSEACVPVLLYHRVSNEISKASRPLCVRTLAFENQMRLFKNLGFRSVTIEHVAEALQGKRTLPKRAVAITFDDGYRDTYLSAYPILQKYGMRATVFLVSRLIGGTNEWDQRLLSTRPVPLLSPAEIQEMSRQGIEFGSHSRTHPKLAGLIDDDLRQEVSGSRRDLEELLQTEVKYFSYPHFSVDRRVERAVAAAGYVAACGGVSLPAEPSVLRIKRIVVSHESPLVLLMQMSGWFQEMRSNRVLRWGKNRIDPLRAVAGVFVGQRS